MARPVAVRQSAWRDAWWLLRAGLSPELIGTQYSWPEVPVQLVIAPLRALRRPGGPSCIIEVGGRRAGFIGRNPLSGNLEYWLQPWARGGVGRTAIIAFLREQRVGDRARRFHVSFRNERSKAALLSAFGELGWHSGDQFEVIDGRLGWEIHVGPG